MFLFYDSRYTKGCVAGLVDEYHNIDIIYNARKETVMYDLPLWRTRKHDHPKKYGKKMNGSCHLPVVRRAGISKLYTMKTRPFNHRRTAYAAVRELSG